LKGEELRAGDGAQVNEQVNDAATLDVRARSDGREILLLDMP
jgi:hypothetical protein